jgi:putative copper resistance protein D
MRSAAIQIRGGGGVDGSLGRFLGMWSLDPFVAGNLVVAAAWYLWAARRVGARSPRARWPLRHSACYLAGLAVLALAYLGPLAAWSHTFFWVHMSQHLLVMMAAAPLLVLGSPVTLAFRASGGGTRRRLVVPILRSRTVRVLTNPILTWALFALVLLGTHFSPFYEWALGSHDAGAFVEQPLYLVAAFLYYFPLIGSNLQPLRPPHSQRLLSLALMMIPEAIVGAVLYFATAILYPTFDTVRPFGLAAHADQQLSGALMWALVMVFDSFWMMYAAAEWLTAEERRGRRIDKEIQAEERQPHCPTESRIPVSGRG